MENITNVRMLTESSISTLKARGYSSSTIKTHEDTHSRLCRFCDTMSINEYSEHIGQQFIEFVQHSNPRISNSTLKRYKNSTRRLDYLLLGVEWKPLRCGRRRAYSKSCYDSVVEGYESFLVKSGKSDKRIRRLVHMAANFLALVEQLGYKQIDSISAEMILTGFEQATDRPCFRNAIGIFLQYVYNRGMIQVNLRHVIPTVVKHHGVPSIYSPEEVERLLASIDRSTESGKRDYAIILVAARLGLRASDIANLRFRNIKSETIEIIQYKTNQPLKMPLLKEVKEAISDYVDHRIRPQSSDHIFLNKGGYAVIEAANIYALTKRAFKRSGIDCGTRKLGTHALRASLATALLAEGNDYPTVQMTLGHMNIESTKFYAKSDIEQLRSHAIPVPPLSGILAALLSKEEPRS